MYSDRNNNEHFKAVLVICDRNFKYNIYKNYISFTLNFIIRNQGTIDFSIEDILMEVNGKSIGTLNSSYYDNIDDGYFPLHTKGNLSYSFEVYYRITQEQFDYIKEHKTLKFTLKDSLEKNPSFEFEIEKFERENTTDYIYVKEK